MRAALNRPGSDCRPLRMPATRIGRVLATLRPRDRRDAPAPILASLGPARPGPGRRTWDTALDTPHQLSLSAMLSVTYGPARALASGTRMRNETGCRVPTTRRLGTPATAAVRDRGQEYRHAPIAYAMTPYAYNESCEP